MRPRATPASTRRDLSRLVNQPNPKLRGLEPSTFDSRRAYPVALAADATAGHERQMLVYAQWRVKTDQAKTLIRDLVRNSSVARHAVYSARRAFGNEGARRLIERLEDDPHDGSATHDALKRIDRARR